MTQPHPVDAERGESEPFGRVASNTTSVAGWTVVSRATGFIRFATVAAVLGPTFLGNTYQSTNLVPNMLYELLAGALIASLLVPPLVAHLDTGDPRRAREVANGFLGIILVVFAVTVLIVAVCSPLVMRLFTLGITDPAIRAEQQASGTLLLLLALPQLLFYGIAGTGAAVQNAHGRFGFPAAIPAVENIMVTATMIAAAVLFVGPVRDGQVETSFLLFIGAGSTLAVAIHAVAQWWGARQVGMVLLPTAGWKDPVLHGVMRLAVRSLALASLTAVQYVGIFVVAGAIPGGVVAFTIALNFFNLPVAIGAKPVAVALLPHLSRLHQERRHALFHDEWIRGIGMTLLLAGPAVVAYLLLAQPIATLVSFGEMADPHGISLLSVSLAALAFGIVGESLFLLSTHASMARLDARSPLRAVTLRSALLVPGMVGALLLARAGADDRLVLAVLGGTVSIAALAGAAALGQRLGRQLPRGDERVRRPLVRTGVAAMAMALALVPFAWLAGQATGSGVQLASVVLSVAVGGAVFIGVLILEGAPEPRHVLAALSRGSR